MRVKRESYRDLDRIDLNILRRLQPASVTDALGTVTSYQYDEHGNKTSEQVVHAHGTLQRSWSYFAPSVFDVPIKHRVRTFTDARGIDTDYSWDARGNALGMTRGTITETYQVNDAGDRVLRFDGTTFMLVRGSAGALFPHASGGLWVTGGGQACHFAPQAMLRVEGVSTGAQQIGDTFSLEVRASDEAATVDVALDGAPLTARRVADGWFVYGGALELGWHRLAVTTPAAQVSRTVLIKRLPAVERSFATDIAPIYATHCAVCHYDGNTFGAPDLATVEQWRNLADKIHRRVVEAKNMPPVASRLPEWGEDEVTVINEWLSGGLLP